MNPKVVMEASPEIKPGWSNGKVMLLDPVELGWRLVQVEAQLNLLDSDRE